MMGEFHWYIVPILLFWVLIIGGFVNGFIALSSVAKSGSSATPPFIFDMFPIFIARNISAPFTVPGFLPFLAIPQAEIGEARVIVHSLKLGMVNLISESKVILAYLAGYLPAIVTTPLFALFLWVALGIGTPDLPAPAFPVMGALIGAFAVGDLTMVFDFFQMFVGAVVGLFVGPNLGLGVALGLLFPPHMGICLTAGGIFRLFANRKWPDSVKNGGTTKAVALATGASFVIIPMVILALVVGIFS